MKEVTTTSETTFHNSTATNDLSKGDQNDLPFIDDGDAELDAAIQEAVPLLDHQDQVTSIQVCSISSFIKIVSTARKNFYFYFNDKLTSTANSTSDVSTLLVSERPCSGTDTIHTSEKVIQREYRDV